MEKDKMVFKTGSGKIAIEKKNLLHAFSVFRAIRHPLRLRMLKLLDEQKQLTVTQIYRRLRLHRAVASQQLGILRRAKAVKTEREGKAIFYSVNKQRMAQLARITEELSRTLTSWNGWLLLSVLQGFLHLHLYPA